MKMGAQEAHSHSAKAARDKSVKRRHEGIMRRILLPCILLMIAPFLFWRNSSGAKNTERIRSEVRIAEVPILKPGSGMADAERFLEQLRKIDTTGAPEQIRATLQQHIETVQSFNRNTTNGDGVADARKVFWRAANVERGEPY
jgi:hypothetical protein